MKQQPPGRPFQKGQSGNPNGRPRIPDEVREIFRAHTEEAAKALLSVMKDPEAPPSARVSAAETILSRAWGKPEQTQNVNATITSLVDILAGLGEGADTAMEVEPDGLREGGAAGKPH